jgi:tetrahydromethanopterin S-methyltransferase subunit D
MTGVADRVLRTAFVDERCVSINVPGVVIVAAAPAVARPAAALPSRGAPVARAGATGVATAGALTVGAAGTAFAWAYSNAVGDNNNPSAPRFRAIDDFTDDKTLPLA